MDFRRKQNIIIMIIIIGIVIVFSISNYIKEQRVYVLSSQTNKGDIRTEGMYDNYENRNINNEVSINTIIVHIEGEVVHPGVYELKKTARVFDAIEAAGGLLETADRKKINLAKKIVDEEFIYIPNKNEAEGLALQGPGSIPLGANSGNSSLVNINTAGVEDLKTLPGVGDVLANRIIEYRTEKGGFKSIEELKNVNGIGDKRFIDIKDKVTVR